VTSTPADTGDNTPLAVGVIVFTVFAISLGDALIKLTSGNFVIWQIFVVRSLIAIPCLLLIMSTAAKKSLQWPIAPGWTLLRSLLLMLMWVCYYLSLPHLTLSVAAASYYTLPIFITLISAVVVGDNISVKGWLAVFVGFAGVYFILRPAADDFNAYALLPLVAAILYAIAMILTRTHCRAEHPLMLSLALNGCFVIAGSIAAGVISMLPIESRTGFLLAPWAVLGVNEWLSMGLLAAFCLRWFRCYVGFCVFLGSPRCPVDTRDCADRGRWRFIDKAIK